MKVIMIISDTFRRDHIGAYGNRWIHTPNLDALAACSAVFDNAFIGSYPTGPNRRDTLLGHSDRALPFNGWRFMERNEVTIPELLAPKKVPSQLITDTANCVTRGLNYYKGFTAWTVNRGQEGDPVWLNDSVPLTLTCKPEMIRYPIERWHQVLMNRAHRMVETDWFAPGTFNMGINWLTQNYRRKDFMLWIDTFDPHEPWDPPQHYLDLYDPGYRGIVYEAPTYGLRKKLGITDRELTHLRARYAGEVTMVDTWVGELVSALQRLHVWEDTALIFTSDHGAYFDYPGDAGLICKPVQLDASGRYLHLGQPIKPTMFFPMRPNLGRIPLIVHLPGQEDTKRIASITQPWNIMPTILELFDAPPPETCIGRSLVPVIKGRKDQDPPYAFQGYHSLLGQVVNEKWLYAVWRSNEPPSLFDRKKDPCLTKNVAPKNPDVVKDLHAALLNFMRSAKTEDQYLTGWNTV